MVLEPKKKQNVFLACLLIVFVLCLVILESTKADETNNGEVKEDNIPINIEFDFEDDSQGLNKPKELSSLVKDELYNNVYMMSLQGQQIYEEDYFEDLQVEEKTKHDDDDDDDDDKNVDNNNVDDNNDGKEREKIKEEQKGKNQEAVLEEDNGEGDSFSREQEVKDEKTASGFNHYSSSTQFANQLYAMFSGNPLLNPDNVKIRVVKKIISADVKLKNMHSKLKEARNLLGENSVDQAIGIYENVANEHQTDSIALYKLGLIHQTDEYGRFNFTKSKRYFLKSSLRGNAHAQFEVGFLFSNGLITQEDIDGVYLNSKVPPMNLTMIDPEAFAITNYFFGSLAGDTSSRIALAYRHLNGYGVPKSCKVSAHYYKLAAEQIADGLGTVGLMSSAEHVKLTDEGAIQQKESQNEIMEYYQYNADKGVTTAQLLVGYAYMYGLRGMPQDGEMARNYFEQAAEAGEVEAYGPLGNLYAKGIGGIAQNNETALHYFKEGAALGDAASQNGLGYLHLHGIGVEVDAKKAAQYFNMSALQGNSEGQYNLALLFMNGLGVAQDYHKAYQLMTASAQQGQTMAHYHLGIMHLKGQGVEANCNVAVKFLKHVTERGQWTSILDNAFDKYRAGDYPGALLLYEKAAELGLEVGQINAAYMYDHSLGSYEIFEDVLYGNESHDLEYLENRKALKYYRLASEQGNVEAYVKVGDYYYYGLGTNAKYEKSVYNYRKAADLRNPQAMFNLGYMHENGQGLPQDFHLAKRYYDMAADSDPTALVPVSLAMGKLYIRWGYALGKDFLFGEQKWEDSRDDNPPAGTHHQRQQNQNQQGSWFDRIKRWISKNEDVLLATLFGVLGVLFLLKRLFVRGEERH